MPTFSEHVDFSRQEARNLVSHKLASAPLSPVAGQRYYDTVLNREGVYNGSTWDYAGSGVGGGVSAVSGSAPITSSGGATPTIAISPASGSTAGSMSIPDFNKLAAATASNTASTIVLRDSSGNVAFTTATGSLTGTASNASNLNNQTPAFYLSRTNHGGTQLSNTISDFDTQVRSSRLDQFTAPTSTVSLNSQRITGLAAPTIGSDAANKDYADTFQITSGAGLTKTGSVLNVGAGAGILANADDVAIDTSVVPRKYSQLIGDGTSASITVTHNLNNLGPIWGCSQVASPFTSVMPTATFPTANTAVFTFTVAPTVNQYRVTLIG